MSERSRLSLACALALLAGCSGTTSPSPQDAQTPPADVVVDTPSATDRPAPTDVSVTDVPTSDVPVTDVPASDVPASDVPASDVPASDVPASDVPMNDAGVSPCPTEPPMAGGACGREGLACQYGSDPRESCRTTATCETGRWAVVTPRCTPLVDPAMCPASREVAANTDCSTLNATCDYAGLGCTCTNCRSFPVSGCSGPLRWRCTAPSMEPNCPAVQPRLGTLCPMNGQRCGYDCEATGPQGGRVCSEGVWQPSPNNCPISSAAAKRDIRYLSPDESAAVANAALRTRLATYEYTDPALRGPRRLGFIYEDSTTHPYARNPDISGVDLYGYTSMLLATVQQQQRQIESLQRAVGELRARRPRR